eukprot:5988701-Amphidinium_carterae.1
MLVVLGELGDTPLPNEQDAQSVEEFMDVLQSAVQARQAVRNHPLWGSETAGSGSAEPVTTQDGQGGPETAPSEQTLPPFSGDYTAALEARLHAANLDRAEEIPENLLADLDDYYTRLRLWEESG